MLKPFFSCFCLFIGMLLLCSAAVEIPDDYESRSAKEKLDLIYDFIKDSEDTQMYYPSLFGMAWAVLRDDFSPSVDHVSDFVPYNHEKRIHSVGAVATMEYESVGNDHSYTGLFQQGTPHALVRLSAARPYTEQPIPGVAVKLFRDGMPSCNFVAMHSLDAQEGGNFFKHNFSNHIEEPDSFFLKLGLRAFERAATPATSVGISDIASNTKDGTKVSQPNFPFQLTLVPNPELQSRFQDTPATDEDLKDTLLSIPEGTKLWDVYARSSPTTDELELIGTMKMTSKLVYSRFGDGNLFFRHQRVTDDWDLRPEWNMNDDGQRRLRKRCPLGFDGSDEINPHI